ncbi:MAG: IS3 family transposase [Mucilaginibacter sp.]
MRVEQREKSRCTGLLCSLLGYSRQAYYKNMKTHEAVRFHEVALLSEIEVIRREQPRLGGRKLLYKLDSFMASHEILMGRDAFFDLLRDQGLLVCKRRCRKPRTTFSYHHFHKYPNRITGFTPIAPNQLWVSDITYIRLNKKFAYLSLITDAYSRRIVGFNLCKTLEASGCILALKMAVKTNPFRSDGLLHHSDRGIQYCSNDYVAMLELHKIGISMTQSGDPLENAIAERVNGILKDELLKDQYELYSQAQPLVNEAIAVYNSKRPHSSIGMLTPDQAHLQTGELKKLWKNYYTFKKEGEAIMAG